MEFNPDGSGQKIFAKGLRNAVGWRESEDRHGVVTVNGATGWATICRRKQSTIWGKMAAMPAGLLLCDRVPDSTSPRPATTAAKM